MKRSSWLSHGKVIQLGAIGINYMELTSIKSYIRFGLCTHIRNNNGVTIFEDTKEECPSCKSKDTELEFNTYEYPMEKSRYCKKCGDKYTNLESVHKAVKQFVKGKKHG